jgi:toxin HigB-1
VIRSFKNRVTEAVFNGQCPKGFPADIFPVARRKLGMLEAARTLNALRVPPREPAGGLEDGSQGTALDPNQRSVANMLSVTELGPEAVEIVDYH